MNVNIKIKERPYKLLFHNGTDWMPVFLFPLLGVPED